jgi:hypothetical protein
MKRFGSRRRLKIFILHSLDATALEATQLDTPELPSRAETLQYRYFFVRPESDNNGIV